MAEYEYIAQNLREIRDRMEAARINAGRQTGAELMAVTKYVDADRINYAIDHCGVNLIGENRVQELCDKYDQLHLDGVKVHLIGTLQTNKVKYIIDKVDMIESVDSEKLAREIDRQAQKKDVVMDCLAEVNISCEENKSGVLPQELDALCEVMNSLQHIRLRGVMTIGKLTDNQEEQLGYFRKTQQLFQRVKKEYMGGDETALLSMGMSDSMESAVMAGSHLVRIGTAIFGKRDYSATVKL